MDFQRFHNRCVFRALFTCALFGSALALTGCGRFNPFDEVWLPWQRQDDHYENAQERIARYRAMSAGAASKSADVQQRESQELADNFQSETDPMVRAGIVLSVANYPTAEAKGVLLSAVRDSNANTRKAACLAWGKRGDAEAISILSDVLDSEEDRDVKLVAVEALGKIKSQATVPILAKRLEDSDVAVQHRAMRSLENVTERYHGNNVEAWQRYARGENIPSETPSVAERFRRLIY